MAFFFSTLSSSPNTVAVAFSLGGSYFQKTVANIRDAAGVNNNNRDRNNEITVSLAKLPEDLPGIRDCRSTVDFANQTKLLASQRSFLNATALMDPKLNAICLVAKNAQGVVVGTTDCRVGMSEVVVNNVLVRPDQRGQGIGEKMMVGVETLVLPTVAANTAAATKLTLNVYTNNVAAVRLYEKCGFEISDPANAAVFGLSKLTGAALQVSMSKKVGRY